jgi:potassium/hydrogen antiporter
MLCLHPMINMSFSAENILLIGSILLFVSIIASKTSFTLGVPTLILFLIIGMLAGSDGVGGIYFDDPAMAQFLGIVALNLILFSGGLDTKWETTRPIMWRGIILSTIGVFITAFSVGVFVHYITDFSLLEGLLLGAIVSSTDAAAVFSILRTKNIVLKRHLGPTLEFESGSNDPMAFSLTLGFIYLLQHENASILTLLFLFLKEMLIGGAAGFIFGKLIVFIINRIRLEIEGLYPVLTLSLIFFSFAFTNAVGGNGFLTVYIAALVVGHSNFIHKKSLMRFYDGQAWLVQIIMFLTLGLLVFPSRILPIVGVGILIALFLMLVARPLAVFISLAFFKIRLPDKIFLSWVGLRGAVPIVFATYPMIAGLPKSDLIFHLVFFISVSSVLLQGTTLPTLARWLKLSIPGALKAKQLHDAGVFEKPASELTELLVPDRSEAIGKEIVSLPIPATASIVLIKRGELYFSPEGSTILEPNDTLWITTDSNFTMNKVKEALLEGTE